MFVISGAIRNNYDPDSLLTNLGLAMELAREQILMDSANNRLKILPPIYSLSWGSEIVEKLIPKKYNVRECSIIDEYSPLLKKTQTEY